MNAEPAKKTYVCGVCKQTREGDPKGGFCTTHGEVLACSSDCFHKGIAGPDVCTMAEMQAKLATMS
jgi:hypothetical protein